MVVRPILQPDPLLGERASKYSSPFCFCDWSLAFPDLDDSCCTDPPLHQVLILGSISHQPGPPQEHGRSHSQQREEECGGGGDSGGDGRCGGGGGGQQQQGQHDKADAGDSAKSPGWICLKFIYTTSSYQPTQCIQGESWLDSKPTRKHPKCFQLQCNAFSNPGWLCHHCPAHSCSIFSSSQVMFHLIS